MLQKLWALRPEYREKQAFTITAGVGALIREIERAERQIGNPAPTSADTSREEADEIPEVPDPILEAQKAQLAADKMWG